MAEINFNAPVKLEEVTFNVALDRQRNPLPLDVQQRVDTAFNYIGAKLGQDELLTQYVLYRQARGTGGI